MIRLQSIQTPRIMPCLEGGKKGQWGYERKEGGRQEAGAANDALPHAAVSAELDLVASKNQMKLLGERFVYLRGENRL